MLEACCRSPLTLQRDLKRARIVLLAAAGRSTRSIAKEVGVQPRIVSLWRRRYADQGLEGLQDKPRPGKQPIYTKATDKRILKLLDKPPPDSMSDRFRHRAGKANGLPCRFSACWSASTALSKWPREEAATRQAMTITASERPRRTLGVLPGPHHLASPKRRTRFRTWVAHRR